MKFQVESPEPEKLLAYVRSKGKQGKRGLEVLAKHLHFLDALNTDIGFEILKDLCAMHEAALEKVASLEAKDEDKIRYKILQEIIVTWANRINTYFEAVGMINKQ